MGTIFENFLLDALNSEQKLSVKKPVDRAGQKPVDRPVNRRRLEIYRSGRENPDRFHLWDRASATEAVDSRSGKTIDYKNWYLQLSCLTFSIKKKSVKLPSCMVDRWADGSLTRRPKGPYMLSPSQGNLVNKL